MPEAGAVARRGSKRVERERRLRPALRAPWHPPPPAVPPFSRLVVALLLLVLA